MFEKIAESVIEFAKAIFQGNKVALAILLGSLLFILSNHSTTNKPIELPTQAHNTIGNLPIVETFDDGGTNKEDQGVESRPKSKTFFPTHGSHNAFYSIVSFDAIVYR